MYSEIHFERFAQVAFKLLCFVGDFYIIQKFSISVNTFIKLINFYAEALHTEASLTISRLAPLCQEWHITSSQSLLQPVQLLSPLREQSLQFLHKHVDVLELTVHGREADVSYLIYRIELLHDQLADLAALDLGQGDAAQAFLNLGYDDFQTLYRNGTLLTGADEATEDFVTAELFAAAVFLMTISGVSSIISKVVKRRLHGSHSRLRPLTYSHWLDGSQALWYWCDHSKGIS